MLRLKCIYCLFCQIFLFDRLPSPSHCLQCPVPRISSRSPFSVETSARHPIVRVYWHFPLNLFAGKPPSCVLTNAAQLSYASGGYLWLQNSNICSFIYYI